MELVLRGSEYQSFLNCRKQWYYQWVEELEAKRPDGKLFFGTLFHKWLEFYYQSSCSYHVANKLTTEWFDEQETKDMEQQDIDEMLDLLQGIAVHYDNTYQHKDSAINVLGTEVEVLVKLDEDLFMTGTIDLVYSIDGKIRFMDHKTVSSIQMYEDKSKMDRQISRYWWVLKMISAGIGRIKDKTTDTWVRWEELIGKEIDGFDYNLIAKDFPREPKVLKSGKLSTDKSQKTTYDIFMAEINKRGFDPNEYADILHHLKNKQDPFLKRLDVKRSDAELESAAWEFSYTAGDIHDIKLMIKNNPQSAEPLTYRNIGQHCMHMCQYKTLCQTAIDGGNVKLARNLGYKKREEK